MLSPGFCAWLFHLLAEVMGRKCSNLPNRKRILSFFQPSHLKIQAQVSIFCFFLSLCAGVLLSNFSTIHGVALDLVFTLWARTFILKIGLSSKYQTPALESSRVGAEDLAPRQTGRT